MEEFKASRESLPTLNRFTNRLDLSAAATKYNHATKGDAT
jgi:hypothetical protein